jgi:hypothetical protein
MRQHSRQKLLQEAKARDQALDLFEVHRADLVEMARAVAIELAQTNGRVSGPEVTAELRKRGLGEALDSVDRRFMGAVFRAGKCWVRVGWESIGSHNQPVSVWKLASERAASG